MYWASDTKELEMSFGLYAQPDPAATEELGLPTEYWFMYGNVIAKNYS